MAKGNLNPSVDETVSSQDRAIRTRDHLLDYARRITDLIPPEFDYFLFYGTLLGFYREGNVIVGDTDVDILMDKKHEEDFIELAREKYAVKHVQNRSLACITKRLVNEECKKTNFQFQCSRWKCRPKVEAQFYRHHPDKDIILEDALTDSMRIGQISPLNVPLLDEKQLYYPKDMIFPIKTGEMQGFEVKIPNDPRACCEYLYGKDYMKPKKDEKPWS